MVTFYDTSAGRWAESWLGVARSASRRERQWTAVGDSVSIRARVLGQHQHGHAGTHRGRGGCHSADKGTLVDIFNFTLLSSLISFLKMCKTVAFTIILTIFTILRWIIFSFFDMMTISKWKIYFPNLMFPRTNSIKFLFWCLIVLWMDGRRILNCKIARAKCKDWSFVQLLFNSNDDYQYTSTEFEWLLDMVNYTLQVTRISSVNFSL